MEPVFIVGIARTPIGSFQGGLSQIPAPKLGAHAIKEALLRAKLAPEQVSEVIMGQVLTAGAGQAPARQAAIFAGIPHKVPALTVGKVCGSGMKAAMLGMQSIRLGDSQIVVTGGQENMSLAPYLLSGARSGLRMGNQPFLDSMILDGLWDPYQQKHMGGCGDLCAKEKNITRTAQDEYARESFERAQKAWSENCFDSEVAPLSGLGKKGDERFAKDEGPFKVKFEKIPELKPAFGAEGSVTAANASTLNDGAAALVLVSEGALKEYGLKPIAKLVSYANVAQAPEWFTTAPAPAMKLALTKASWQLKDIDLFEVNEAFAVVAIAAMKELNISRDRLNIWGGAIALGHPIGASGARILVTLISALKKTGGKKGLASICIGGGEATAICVEMCS